MVVLDASAGVELLLGSRRGVRIRDRLAGQTIHVPHLLDVEVLNALRGLERARILSTERAQTAAVRLGGLPLVRYDHAMLGARIWVLRGNLSAYDAAYVALAEALDAPLVTTDAKLGSAEATRATIEVIA